MNGRKRWSGRVKRIITSRVNDLVGREGDARQSGEGGVQGLRIGDAVASQGGWR